MPSWLFMLTPGRMPTRSDAVGQRVRVYWADEDEWFSGHVQDADDAQGYFVLYDDGDERWESLAQRVEFEENEEQQQRWHYGDEEESDTEGGEVQQQLQEQQRTGGRVPEMMEPPASPTGDAYDDDNYDEVDEAQRNEDKREQDALGEGAVGGSASERDDGDEDMEKIDLGTAGIARTAFRLQEDDDDNSDACESKDQQGDDDDGEQSVAMSEVPITFERGGGGSGNHSHARSSVHPLTARSSNSSSSHGIGVTNAGVNVPARGILRGKVIRASHLPGTTTSQQAARSNRRPINSPRAFVKITFVEAAAGENPKHANIMLRCKNALASTSVAVQSNHPVWNDDDNGGSGAEADGAFQMQLVPPVKSPKEPPAWLQLRSDVLFSVYSVSTGVGSDGEEDEEEKTERGRRRHVHDFIGQAVLSLQELLRDVLFGGSMSITHHLPLQSRQGKPLVARSSRTRNAFEDVESDDEEETSVVMAPEIVVSFEFEPTYLEDTRQKLTMRSKHTSQSSRSLTKDRGPTSSARSLASQPKSKDQHPKQQATAPSKPKSQAKKTTHTSSSTINRRKFEKQVDQQNVAFAKRLEWQDHRRARLSEHAKAQVKSKQPIPQHGTMKLDHKASSGVNRTKFQQQVRQENRAMEKRLHAIIIKDVAEKEHKGGGGAKDHEGVLEGVLEFSDVGFDDLDKDKVLARDRRHHKLREQDFLMARAQAKYQQQNQVVEEVMKLQGELAELKIQVFNAKAAVTRLDILNNKDQHLCKCLRSAAEPSQSVVVGSNGSSSNRSFKCKTTKQEKCGDDTSGDAGVTRQRKELELLKKESASLQSEKERLSQELRACNQQEQEFDDEIHRLTSQLRFVQKKQAFQLRMSSRAGAELQFAKEMKKKQQLLELSKDDEELWALHQAQQELTQLQIAVQVLKERSASATTSNSANLSSSSSVACEYLGKKIERQKQKLEQLEQEQSHFQREYELLLISSEQETLRRQVHELQQTLFLCQAQQKHARVAQKHAKYADEKLTMEFQTKVFQEQTETEILFKKKTKQ